MSHPEQTPAPPPKANDERWARLTASQHRHRKFRGLDLDATGLWTLGLSWVAENQTDGFIPEDEVRYLSPAKPARVALAVKMLVARGLWDRAPKGYRIHDYLDVNVSVAYMESFREAGRKGAAIRWGRNGGAIRGAISPTNAEVEVEKKRTKASAPAGFFKAKAAEKVRGQASPTTYTAEQAIREEQALKARVTAIAGPCPTCGATTGPHDLTKHRRDALRGG
jgi:hypothetical protein